MLILRRFADTEQIGPLQIFASVLEPVSFDEQASIQHPNALTPLNQLADALPPDPPSRHNFEVLVRSYLQDPRARKHEEAKLVAGFNSWIASEPAILQLMSASPQLAQAELRAPQLAELGTTGIEAVWYLSSGLSAAAGWKTEKLALIDTAEKPQALVRFTVIKPLHDLANAVSEPTAKYLQLEEMNLGRK